MTGRIEAIDLPPCAFEVVNAEHRGRSHAAQPAFLVATVTHRWPGDNFAEAALAYFAVAHERGIWTDETIIPQCLNYGHVGIMCRLVSGRRNEWKEVCAMQYVRTLAPD